MPDRRRPFIHRLRLLLGRAGIACLRGAWIGRFVSIAGSVLLGRAWVGGFWGARVARLWSAWVGRLGEGAASAAQSDKAAHGGGECEGAD